MSAQTAGLHGAIKAADDDLSGWLKGLVTGKGDNPSQVIISGVLSVVPGLGQAMDLRDLIVGIITISEAPTYPMAWLDMSITVIGCVPVMGDGLKTGFRLMKGGQALPRILDGLSPALRGNVEHWFRTINWADIAKHVKGTFDDMLGAFIQALDSWLARMAMGKDEVRFLIRQIEDMRTQAPKMLDEAIEELKVLWRKAMGDVSPKSTAGHSEPHAPLANKVETTGGSKPKSVKRDKTAEKANTPDKTNVDERRASEKKKKKNISVLAEHLTDYWCARNKRNIKKANNTGRLWEEWDREGRHGIDHVWVQSTEPVKPGIIGETKSSLFGAFRLLAALPQDIRDQLKVLGDAEAANPTENGQPNIFHSEGRDSVDPGRVRVAGTAETEEELKKGLGKSNPETGLANQLSHQWIIDALPEESLTQAGKELLRKVVQIKKRRATGEDVSWPYSRWIIMVTGRQKQLHLKSQGHQHEIQKPLITLPDNILDK